jgi:hypothetical protein
MRVLSKKGMMAVSGGADMDVIITIIIMPQGFK